MGCVSQKDAVPLAEELSAKLSGLRDEENINPDGSKGAVGVNKAYVSSHIFKGPYRDEAPDLVVGYAAGWRASWDGVRGVVGAKGEPVFDDNNKAWSGDHCIDPELVPGVLFINKEWNVHEETPAIADLAPTVLDMFGVPSPKYMDGKSLT